MKTHLKQRTLALALICTLVFSGCNKTIPVTEVDDIDVTTRVKTTLISDPILKNINITVATIKGDVKLIGILDNQSQIDHALAVTRSIEGVHTIHDELVVRK